MNKAFDLIGLHPAKIIFLIIGIALSLTHRYMVFKPHIHVYHGDYEASVGIDGELSGGSIPVKQMKLLNAWLIIHEDELSRSWFTF